MIVRNRKIMLSHIEIVVFSFIFIFCMRSLVLKMRV